MKIRKVKWFYYYAPMYPAHYVYFVGRSFFMNPNGMIRKKKVLLGNINNLIGVGTNDYQTN